MTWIRIDGIGWWDTDPDPTPPDGMVLCPSCEGRCLPEVQMDRQYNATGDTSGACGMCENKQFVPADPVTTA